MPITNQTTYNEYTANGVTTTFAFSFKVLASTQVKVYVNGVVQSSGYSVTGIGNAGGGNVVFTTAPTASALVRIIRLSDQVREYDYIEAGGLSADTLDNDQDYQTMMIQELGDQMLSVDPSTGVFDANGVRIENLGFPQVYTDAATVQYVDELVADITAGGGGAIPLTFAFTGDASTWSFSTPDINVANPGAYIVTINGLTQVPVDDYSVDVVNQRVEFVTPPANGTEVVIRVFGYSRALADQGLANSVLGRAAGTTGDRGDIIASVDGHVLKRSGGILVFGQMTPSEIANLSAYTGFDARYYTETELDAGQLDNRYYTETELNAGQLDTRYFTESEVTSSLAGKSDTGHTHVAANITDFNTAADARATAVVAASSINALSDVTITSPSSGQVIKYNGSAWVNGTDETSAGGTNADTFDGLDSTLFIYGANGSGSRTAATTWAASDLSQYKSGFWDINGATWTPDTEWYWGLTNAHTSNSSSFNYSGQFIIKNSTSPEAYIRTITAGSPAAWRRIWTDGNDGAGSGLDADLVDGLQVHTSTNNEANKIVRTDVNGYMQCGYIHSASGNEGNAFSPARVWGTNGSDSYMRTYLTSTLQVAYASSAGSASTATSATTATSASSATTFTSTTQNSRFNSIGVNTAASGTAGEIRATNNITAYYSDERLKTKLGNIPNALDKVLSLNGFYFEANETAQALGYEKKKEVGVSAQEVFAVLPEITAPAPIDDKYLTVHYEKLVPLLIEAIKEQQAQIEELKRLLQ